MSDPIRQHCRHIHPSGHRCGSPSLRHENFCYYHHTTRPAISKSEAQTRSARQSTFTLLEPDNRTAIQLNLGEIMRRLAANDLDPKRAGLLLYALQIASSNLPKPTPQTVETIEEITLDDTHGPLAPASEFQSAPHEKSLEQILLEQWHKDDLDEAAHQSELSTELGAPHLASEMWDGPAPEAPCPIHDSLTVISGPTRKWKHHILQVHARRSAQPHPSPAACAWNDSTQMRAALTD